MRLLSFKHNAQISLGVIGSDESVLNLAEIGLDFNGEMLNLIKNYNDEIHAKIIKFATQTGGLEYEKITKCAPIINPAQDIICLGINYLEHAKESYKFKKIEFDGKRELPVYFGKRVNFASADTDILPSHSDITDSLDYECELACIIGKDAKNVGLDEVDDYIFGWTILNDISARNIQNRYKQWYGGKSLDQSCPMGPWIVTKDEIDTSNLAIKTYINGELRQNSNTSQMIFDIKYVINDLSKFMSIKAGSIISLGTPSGVGMGYEPPKYLKSGDEIVCEIEKIGKLRNKIL